MPEHPTQPIGSARPTLSVILPNYNHAKVLSRSIDSILSQTQPPDELLIIDDASTDNSWELLSAYAARVPYIRLLRNETNRGVLATLKRLIELARGDYLHWTASDDEHYPGFFAGCMQLAARYPEAGAIIGKVQMCDEEGNDLGVMGMRRWSQACYASPRQYLQDCFNAEEPSHSLSLGTILHRQRILDLGGFPTDLASYSDTFLIHAAALKHGAAYFPEPCAIWYRQQASFSQTTAADPRRTLDMIAKSARRMRSPEFRDVFPKHAVGRWKRRYRWRTIREHWRGDLLGELPPHSPLWRRLAYRLPRSWAASRLFFYRGGNE